MWNKVALLGVGLLGGSLGLALKQRRLAEKVDGFVRRSATIAECQQMGVVDHATRELERAVSGADLVVLCTPLAQMPALAAQMAPYLQPGAVVTDVGSVKGNVVRELEPIMAAAGAHFIGSHPMAGSEKQGVLASQARLYEGAVCVVTPTARSDARALARVEELWAALGSQVLRLTPELHDELVSRSSHLPHVVAAELANYVLSPLHPLAQGRLCATGFRDTTRIASSSPEMWRDIALANRAELSRVMGIFIEGLEEFRHALERADARALEEFFTTARQRRDAWVSQASGTTPE